jgi:hypothetical protein
MRWRAIEQTTRAVWHHHSEPDRVTVRGASDDRAGGICVAAIHRAHRAGVVATKCRALLEDSQRDLHYRIASMCVRLEGQAVGSRGPFPETRDTQIFTGVRISTRHGLYLGFGGQDGWFFPVS